MRIDQTAAMCTYQGDVFRYLLVLFLLLSVCLLYPFPKMAYWYLWLLLWTAFLITVLGSQSICLTREHSLLIVSHEIFFFILYFHPLCVLDLKWACCRQQPWIIVSYSLLISKVLLAAVCLIRWFQTLSHLWYESRDGG